MNCPDCPLSGRPYVPPELPPEGEAIWFVGEAPGFEEVRERKPFVGRSGRLLRGVIRDTGFENHFPVLITNACLCHPEGNETPPLKAVRACRKNLEELKEKYRPIFIIALGKIASRALGLPDIPMEELRGRIFETEFGRCTVTYHPSAVLRTRYRLKTLFEMDIKKAFLTVKGKIERIDPPDIRILSDTEEIIQALSSLKGNVAFDIETSIPGEEGKWEGNGVYPYDPQGRIVSMAFSSNELTFAFYLDPPERREMKPERITLFERVEEPVKAVYPSIDRKRVIEALSSLFLRDDVFLIAHNGKFEMEHIRTKLGLNVRIFRDTMIMAYLINETAQGFYSLDALVSTYLPSLEGYKEKFLKKDLLLYNAMDAFATLRLYEKLDQEIENSREKEHLKRAEAFIMEHVYPLLVSVELSGVKVDRARLEDFGRTLNEIKNRLIDEIEMITGERDVRTKKFREIFYALYEYDPPRTDKGELSMDAESIAEVFKRTKKPMMKRLASFRYTLALLDKIETSYIRPYLSLINPVTKRIHPSYRITGTETGRLSCSNPNFQQIPRSGILMCRICHVSPFDGNICPLCGSTDLIEILNIKEAITTEDGNLFLTADFSQMEVRVLAHISGDENLISVIRDGLDMHSYTASRVFCVPYEEIRDNKDREPYSSMRQKAKAATFGVIYGSTARGLAEEMGISEDEAKSIIERFYESFPRVRMWIEDVHSSVKQNGWYYSPIGRVRRFHVPDSASLREAQNFPVQSYASDLTLAAASEIERRLKPIGGKIVGLVHDSIEAEVPEDRIDEVVHIIRFCMTEYVERMFSLKVLLKVDISWGRNWAEAEKKEKSHSLTQAGVVDRIS